MARRVHERRRRGERRQQPAAPCADRLSASTSWTSMPRPVRQRDQLAHPEAAAVAAVRAAGAQRMVRRHDHVVVGVRAQLAPDARRTKSRSRSMPAQAGRSSASISHQSRSIAISATPRASPAPGSTSVSSAGPGQPPFGSNAAGLSAKRVDEALLARERRGAREGVAPVVVAGHEDLPGARGAQLLEQDALAALVVVAEPARIEVVAQEDHRGLLGQVAAPAPEIRERGLLGRGRARVTDQDHAMRRRARAERARCAPAGCGPSAR